MSLMNIVSPYLSGIVLILIDLILALVFTGIILLRKQIAEWITNVKNEKQRSLLETICNEAFSLIEQELKGKPSQEKLNKAIEYAASKAEKYGLNVDTKEIHAKIEQAVIDYNIKIGKI